VHVLDRVFDRDDVLPRLGVDLVDDGGERGALARAGGAGDEHEAARLVAISASTGGRPSSSSRQDLEGDRAEGARHRAALHEDVGAEAREVASPRRRGRARSALEARALLLGEDLVAEPLRVGLREHRAAGASGTSWSSMRSTGASPP
jgi:hypothetical protein